MVDVVDHGGQSTDVSDALGGRINIFDIDLESGSRIGAIEQPEWGHVSITPGGELALSLSNETDTGSLSFSYEVIEANGETTIVHQVVDVAAPVQQAAWATGENTYMLELDDSGQLVVEHGEIHRKVHLSGSDGALTKADIAEMLGISTDQVTGKLLAEHPELGTVDMPLAVDAGMALWAEITNSAQGPHSHWLLFERGYEYDDLGRVIKRGTQGESELHPTRITAWGEGDAPVLNTHITGNQDTERNVVIDSIAVEGLTFLGGENILVSDVTLTDETNIQRVHGFTLRDSEILDVYNEATKSDGETWSAHLDRVSGIFVSKSSGVLLDDNLFDHNGWADGYDPALSAEYPQPPSMFSHNVYLQWDNLDVTVRDNLAFRGASYGIQVRSGGLIEDNVFVENNAGLTNLGGSYSKSNYEHVGNFTQLTGNIVTSPGHKTVDASQGAVSYGIIDKGLMTTRTDNIVAHVANPDDPNEQVHRERGQTAITNVDGVPDDTIVWNWTGSRDAEDKNDLNVPDIDPDALDDVTIQNFAAEYLGRETAGVEDLIAALREDGHEGVADLIVDYFQTGFGNRISADTETEPGTVTFLLDERNDGIRWDNRLNWDSGEVAGTDPGADADLAGHYVISSTNVEIRNLDVGIGGRLQVSAGKLTVSETLDGDHSTVEVERSGQFWFDGTSDTSQLAIDAIGGRFVNTGSVLGGTSVSISGNAQSILASNGTFIFGAGDTLAVNGSNALVGMDAGESAGPNVIAFSAGSTIELTTDEGGLSTISEIRSGAFDGQDINSAIDVDGAAFQIDVGGYLDGRPSGGTVELAVADVLVGAVSADDVTVVGLESDRDVAFFVDYDADVIRLEFGELGTGTGTVDVVTLGQEEDDTTDLDEFVFDLRAYNEVGEPVLPAANTPPAEEPSGAIKGEVVYVSASPEALGLSDIASLMNKSFVSAEEAARFIIDNGMLGSSSTPLDTEVGASVWRSLIDHRDGPSPDSLLFERGYQYDFGRIVTRGASGVSEEEPLTVGAWGEGEAPLIDGDLKIFQNLSSHVDIQHVAFTGGATVLGAADLEIDNVTFNSSNLTFKGVDGLDLLNTSLEGGTRSTGLVLADVSDAVISGLEIDLHEGSKTEVGVKLRDHLNESIIIDGLIVDQDVDIAILDPEGVATIFETAEENQIDRDGEVMSLIQYDCFTPVDSLLL